MPYVLTTEIRTQNENDEWWEDKPDRTVRAEVFAEFGEAMRAMREGVVRACAECAFFPKDENGEYVCLTEDKEENLEAYTEMLSENDCGWRTPEQVKAEIQNWETYAAMLQGVITDAAFVAENAGELSFKDDDSANWYFAYVGNAERLHYFKATDHGEILSTNVHCVRSENEVYYFNYKQEDDGGTYNGITLRLLPITE